MYTFLISKIKRGSLNFTFSFFYLLHANTAMLRRWRTSWPDSVAVSRCQRRRLVTTPPPSVAGSRPRVARTLFLLRLPFSVAARQPRPKPLRPLSGRRLISVRRCTASVAGPPYHHLLRRRSFSLPLNLLSLTFRLISSAVQTWPRELKGGWGLEEEMERGGDCGGRERGRRGCGGKGRPQWFVLGCLRLKGVGIGFVI